MAKLVLPEERLKAGRRIGFPPSSQSSRGGPENRPETKDDFKVLGHSNLVENRNVDTKFLAGPLIPAGIPALFVGPPGLGKSTILGQVAMEIASGASLLNLVVPRPLPVAIWGFEDSEENTMRRYQAYLKSLPEEAHFHLMSNFQVRIPSCGQPSFSRLLRDLHRWTEDMDTRARGGGLAICDPLHSIFPGDENSSEATQGFYGEMRHVCAEGCVTVLFVHHIRKVFGNESHNGNSLDRVRGSSAHVASVRSVIEMRPLSSRGELRRSKISVIKINGGPPGASMELEQDPGTGLWRLPSLGAGYDEAAEGMSLRSGGAPEVAMSLSQWKVLETLGSRAGSTREELVSKLFPTDKSGSDKLRSQLRFLRQKGLVTDDDQLTPIGEQLLRHHRP